jgi:hypothetical protein
MHFLVHRSLGEDLLTDVRGNASHNNLLLASSLNRLAELRVVPSVDLALALDEGRIGVHVKNRLGQRAVRSILGRRREHHREIEKLANAGVRDHGVVVQRSVEVTSTVRGEVYQLMHGACGRCVQLVELTGCRDHLASRARGA